MGNPFWDYTEQPRLPLHLANLDPNADHQLIADTREALAEDDRVKLSTLMGEVRTKLSDLEKEVFMAKNSPLVVQVEVTVHPEDIQQLLEERARLKNIRITFQGEFSTGLVFIEVENDAGESLNIGTWEPLPEGRWALKLTARDDLKRK